MNDTEYTDEITCPYCGCTDPESYADGEGEEGQFATECAGCGNTIISVRHIEVTYSTRKPTAKRRPIYGAKTAKCYICGETGDTKMRSDVCDHLVCEDCAASHEVCCDDYRQVLEQVKEEA